MFEKMTKRERVLAAVVACTVPIALLFVGFFVYLGKSEANEARIMGLQGEINDILVLEKQALVAGKQADYYRETSLPSEFDEGVAQYKQWLLQTLEKNNATKVNASEAQPTPVRFNNPDIQGGNSEEKFAQEQGFRVDFDGTILHLTQFLHDFYSLEMLHRISSIKITTRDETDDRSRKKTRSDVLSISMQIQVLALDDAEPTRDFAGDFRQLPKSLEEYQESIVYRNIFGVANTAPDIQVTKSSRYKYKTDQKIKLKATDVDKNDQHTFKLVMSGIEGAKLIDENSKAGTARLYVPGSEEGRYDFEIECTDSGFPAKTKKKKFYVAFEGKPKAKTEPVKTIFKEIGVTYIGSRTMSGGVRSVWIKTRTTGKVHELAVGDSFELDKQTWTVKSLDKSVVLENGQEIYTYDPGDSMDKPSGGKKKL